MALLSWRERGYRLPGERAIMSEQPKPTPSQCPPVWPMVIQYMAGRDILGTERYGDRLRPNNGRDALRDLLEELLDGCAYCAQAIWERDHN